MKAVTAIVAVVLMGATVHAAYAEEWAVRRQAYTGQCSVQRARSHPGVYGQRLATFGTMRRACADALDRFQKSAAHSGDGQKCSGYATQSRNECLGAQVTLP